MSAQQKETLMSRSAADVAGPYSDAWARHDADAILALHSTDSVFHVHGMGKPAMGAESVRQLVTAFLAHVPDLHFEHKRFYLGVDHLVAEYDMSGTAAGSSFVCDGVDVIVVTDGLVSRKDTYLDLVALERQTGLLPQMDI
jgi:ketosteroid isomerase-like protein